MPSTDPVDAARTAKATEALLREARSVQRGMDKVAAAAAASVEDPTAQRLAVDARSAIEDLVRHLMRLQRIQQRRAQEALRRSR